ncbi:putative RNA polymerase II subunit B1 CTD phosphatase RPAP2 [Chrysoperla carnea]|uniref:putative RNA polymerase II subunit B1 CTD phosphatase RPAP2 n=1 Tax=Chrysoperla carnea TaxID=189513 RepID=UPI001D09095E|nr:putative RNA polymerase II subunit B1 CTD phosphatase RPAP2 [Chrysoperla carnea]
MDTENEPQPGPSNVKKKSPKSTNKMPNIKEMSKDEIQAALLKKRQCDADAQKIVERLIENPVPAPWFVYCLKFINQCHIDDVFEERSLINQCGYPICLGILPNFPKKQYMISTKLNKIYDITERKKFCSDKCFNAAVFIREQMLTSPLWLRDKEDIPDFKLLPWTTKGMPGLEINFGVPDNSEIEPDPTQFTSVSDFAKTSLDDAPDTFEEMEKHTFLEEEETSNTKKKAPNTSEKLEKLIKKSNENQQRINRKIIESHFSEIVSEDDLFKYSKHQLKLINLGDRAQALKLSEQISKESLRERLENRRKAMLKQQTEAKSKAKNNTSSVEEISDKVKTLQINSDELKSDDKHSSNENSNKNISKTFELNSNELKTDLQENDTQDLSSGSQEKCEISTKIETIQSTLKQENYPRKEFEIEKSTDFPVQTNQPTSSRTNEKELPQNLSVEETLKINNNESKPIKPSIKSILIEKIKEELPPNPSLDKQIKPPTDLSTTDLAINYIEKCLTEWFTIDSLLFLYGRERVKNDVKSHNKVIQEKLTEFLKESTNNLYENEAYIKLCKKIDMLELEEERYEKSVINRNLKPLPDYRMLRAENKRLIVKVRSFYNGNIEFEEPGLSESETSEESEVDSEIDSDDDEYTTVLPAVDKNSQNHLRRQIVFNCLNKTVPGLLQTFGLTSHDMTSEIRQFISTFYLTAKNIIFKPIHLNLLGVIILRLLGEKNRGLFKLMEDATAIKYSTILLNIYKLPYDYLDQIVAKLTNIESIVDNHCTTKTNK